MLLTTGAYSATTFTRISHITGLEQWIPAKVDQTNQHLQPKQAKITKFSQRELNQRILYQTSFFQLMRNKYLNLAQRIT